MGLSSRMIAALTCAMYMIGVSSAWAQDVSNQKRGFDEKTVTPLVAIREIGLQSHVPIGVVFGANQLALCTGRVSFALHEVTPRDALEEAVRSANYSVEEQDGIILLMAPDGSRTGLHRSIRPQFHRRSQNPHSRTLKQSRGSLQACVCPGPKTSIAGAKVSGQAS
jgi:hypothetical protein